MKRWHVVFLSIILAVSVAVTIYEVRQVDKQIRDFKRCTCKAAQF